MDDDESGTLTAEEMQQLVKDGVEVLMILDGRMGLIYIYRSALDWKRRRLSRGNLTVISLKVPQVGKNVPFRTQRWQHTSLLWALCLFQSMEPDCNSEDVRSSTILMYQ